MKPAMTEKEWATWEADTPYAQVFTANRGNPEERHAVAALCLHGQEFGFTSLSAYAIRRLADHARKTAAKVGPLHGLWDSIFQAEEDANRIEALLPPEGE